MSLAPTVYKQVAEVRTITFDFEGPPRKLLTGDSVSAVVGGALTADSGITAGAPSVVGNTVTALISGGTEGTSYSISCRVTTTLGETLELDVNVYVADGEN